MKISNEFGLPNLDLDNDAYFSQLRQKDFSRLDQEGHTYLDYTGGNLYGESQLKAHFKFLSEGVFGNPHSINPTSMRSSEKVDETRAAVLDFFNAKEDYICVFTANASSALKIVGECYPFGDEGHFLLLADNHNSVNGIWKYCELAGGSFEYAPIRTDNLGIDSISLEEKLASQPDKRNKLFAYPAQSNVSGKKHSLDWISKANKQNWDVLLDAAAFVPTNKLDLGVYKPDFVSVSFYKIFGYPTGMGCLLIHKNKFHKLTKRWFAGGTVKLVTVGSPNYYLTEGHERFEDGTLNYLDIPAIKIGLDYIQEIGLQRINQRVKETISYLLEQLKDLKHTNGQALVRIFGPDNIDERGGTVIFNVFDPSGKVYPYFEIEEYAANEMISIRAGCFCNPGIDEANYCISNEELSNYFINRDEDELFDMIELLHSLRGAIRASVGFITNRTDIDKLVKFLLSFKDKNKTSNPTRKKAHAVL
ncbi:MAG: aminotransferase class V-fold PLP-dependent enzyme [Saprospiraceae bacterium]|nr:aminotransferase class V-fold PLP-dependent enzyme [Saprospiraceae bacterium]